MAPRTSASDPIQIAELHPPGATGTLGVTFCPGKKDAAANWDRDLETDLDALHKWGAAAVITLIEPHEFELLGVAALPDGLERRGIAWFHLPIPDVSIPSREFERAWRTTLPRLRALLDSGRRIVVHCRGGLGRAGTIAACLLVEFGMDAAAAIAEVRRVRPGAIETREQQRHVEALPSLLLADRAAGAMFGAAIGDALGSAFEFVPSAEIERYPRRTVRA